MIARFKVAGVHLLGSLTVVGFFMGLIYFIWYPYPYYIFHSTISATKLVVMVDLVLGPLLTFIVFNTTKPVKELKRDISIIIIVQVLALAWGVYITHSVRPLFAVYFNGEIHSITDVSIDNSGFDQSVNVPSIFQLPELVYIEPLTKEDYRKSVLDQLSGNKLGIVLQTHRYRSVNNVFKKDMISRSLQRSQLASSEDKKKMLHDLLSTHKFKYEEVLFFPVSAGPYNAVIVIEKDTMQVIDTLDMYIKNTSEY